MNDEVKKRIEDLFNKADNLERQGQHVLALNTYLELLKIYPDHVSALNNSGALFCRYKNDMKNGLECYNRAIRNDPKNVHSIIGKGSVMVGLGNLNDALLYYQNALKIESNNHDAKIGIAGVLFYQKNDEGLNYLDEVLDSNPNHITALFNKATYVGMNGDLDTAIELLDKILVLDPRNQAAIHQKTVAEFERRKNNQ